MTQPEFEKIASFEEFSKYYWYREELQKICRSLGLKSDGGKIELNKVIESYFAGERILPVKKTASCHPEHVSGSLKQKLPKRVRDDILSRDYIHNLSLQTSIIECNFTFGNRFREFFASQTGIQKFKFNADMVATVKKVKEIGDTGFTLGDLLDIYYGKKTYAK